MRYDKFTIKSQELVQNAQELAARLKNPQVEPEHLLAVMLTETEGIAGSILQKMGVAPGQVAGETNAVLERLPKVSQST
ncbi:MAG: Clp protease N-terminal domain-containing protein, partial [Desulfobacterales bacterium]